MAHRVADRTGSYSATTGTGDFTIGANIAGHQGIASALTVNGDTSFYHSDMGDDYEVGLLTRSSATVYTRTIYESTNADAAVSWGAGNKEIVLGLPARFCEILNTIEITVASATTCDIGAAQGVNVVVSGTTGITGFGTQKNKIRRVRHTGALTLTNAATLVCPYATNLTVAAGDSYWVISDDTATPIWRIVGLTRASAATEFSDIKQAATTSATGVVELATDAEAQAIADTARAVVPANLAAMVATQANQETGTANDRFVTPGRQHFHPTACKVWAKYNNAGAASASHNVSSIGDLGTGQAGVNLTVAFSTANYSAGSSCINTVASDYSALGSVTAGAIGTVTYRGDTGAVTDVTATFAWGFGDL